MTNKAKKSLQLQQLSSKMGKYTGIRQVVPPPTGWIRAIRTTLGMSMQQLGNRLSVTKQSVLDMERREHEGSITIRALREAATALDMELVYGFVPAAGSLEGLIERKAKALAREIVLRTSTTMKLENQENTKQRIEQAIEERAVILKNEMPKALWD